MRYCWEELANAIVLQAVKDYRIARWRVRRFADAKKSQTRIRECERFFRSEWFRVLTEIDGEQLISDLRSEAA